LTEPLILAEPETPFWGFGEVFVSAACFLIAVNLIAGTVRHFVGDRAKLGTWEVTEELAAYLVMFAVLKLIFSWYGASLLPSLGWVKAPLSEVSMAGWGLALFFMAVLLQILLRMPQDTETPFDKAMFSDHYSRFVMAIFGVTAGPVIEEVWFRGLLHPVLTSATGVFPGILITSVFFAAMHLTQYAFIWQSGVVLTAVAFGLGVIRQITGSTRASSVAHIAYNALPFALTLMQGAQPPHK